MRLIMSAGEILFENGRCEILTTIFHQPSTLSADKPGNKRGFNLLFVLSVEASLCKLSSAQDQLNIFTHFAISKWM